MPTGFFLAHCCISWRSVLSVLIFRTPFFILLQLLHIESAIQRERSRGLQQFLLLHLQARSENRQIRHELPQQNQPIRSGSADERTESVQVRFQFYGPEYRR